MAQQVKVLATKPHNLILVLETHMVEKKELTSESWTLKSVGVSLTETYKLEKYDWNEIKFTKVKVSFFLTSEKLAGLNKMTL